MRKKNIKKILDALHWQITENIVITNIVVVSSGSTDRTDDIVREYCLKYPNFYLIREKERAGKAAAINSFFTFGS